MANNLGGNPSSGGWSPPSDREHPPFKGGQKTSCVGSGHSPGPNGPIPAGNTTQTSNLANAVIRPPNGIRQK